MIKCVFKPRYEFCADCIHHTVCMWQHCPQDQSEHCQFYKDKSLVVELPCKVGDDVWFNTFKKNATVCIGIQPHKVDRIDVCLVCGEKELIETKIPIWQIGKTVFLTKEEAEAMLEEMQ